MSRSSIYCYITSLYSKMLRPFVALVPLGAEMAAGVRRGSTTLVNMHFSSPSKQQQKCIGRESNPGLAETVYYTLPLLR